MAVVGWLHVLLATTLQNWLGGHCIRVMQLPHAHACAPKHCPEDISKALLSAATQTSCSPCCRQATHFSYFLTSSLTVARWPSSHTCCSTSIMSFST